MSEIDVHKIRELDPPQRVLMGPGPSNVHPRVYKALSMPIIGHLDPRFLQIMDEVQALLRWVFQTTNRFTLAMPGTGSSGMEATFVNTVEPGDTVIIGINGVFGNRMADIVERCGGNVIRVEAPWGQIVDPQRLEDAFNQANTPIKALAIVHAETSTGVRQPIEELGALCHQHDALFIVDAVTSLAGIELKVDEWEIDVCYSGTQKCLSCPPGLAPITFSDRAIEIVRNRSSKVQSWYLDLNMILNYWEDKSRAYHHTAPINMFYALREALRLVQEDTLERRHHIHRRQSNKFLMGCEDLGLEFFIEEEEYRLPMLNVIRIPDHVHDLAARQTLLLDYNLEIGAGLGELAGKVWRVGLMGETAKYANVVYLLEMLEPLIQHK